jgi:hypothetical protein
MERVRVPSLNMDLYALKSISFGSKKTDFDITAVLLLIDFAAM